MLYVVLLFKAADVRRRRPFACCSVLEAAGIYGSRSVFQVNSPDRFMPRWLMHPLLGLSILGLLCFIGGSANGTSFVSRLGRLLFIFAGCHPVSAAGGVGRSDLAADQSDRAGAARIGPRDGCGITSRFAMGTCGVSRWCWSARRRRRVAHRRLDCGRAFELERQRPEFPYSIRMICGELGRHRLGPAITGLTVGAEQRR